MINIIVNGQSLSGECKRLASDSVDYIRCSFSFSSDWYGLTKTAQFTQNGKTFDVLVENDTCTLPSEIVAGDVEISVFGVESGGTKRITTIPFTASVKASGFVCDGEVPIPPTPDLYSQLIKRVEDAVDEMPDSLSLFTNDMGFVTDEAVPTKLSELENDAGFITDDAVPTKVSELENDAGFITDEAVPTKLSELENDAGFVTDEGVPTKLSELENDTGFITDEGVPTKLSELENDAGFITDDAVPTKVSELENDAEYVKKTDVATNGKCGVVMGNGVFGTGISSNGSIYLERATNAEIDARSSIHKPITPYNLEYAVKSVGDGYYATQEDINNAGYIKLTADAKNYISVDGPEGSLFISAYDNTINGSATTIDGNYITLQTYMDNDINVVGGKLAIEEPVNSNHAATKGYVDALIDELRRDLIGII